MIYLDNAATTYPKPEQVYEALNDAFRNIGASPGRSGHQLAMQANRKIYETRELIKDFFNLPNEMSVVFTPNATLGLNMAIKGMLKSGDHVIVSDNAHNSVIRPIKAMADIDYTLVYLDEDNESNQRIIKDQIKKNTKMIIITHASNVTGDIIDIESIGQIAKENNISLLVDGAQTAGAIPIDVQKMNIDLLAFSGHKSLYGPPGTGALYINPKLNIKSLIEGGTGSQSESLEQPEMMPDKFESGTPNMPAIVALGEGIKYINEVGIDQVRAHEMALTNKLLEGLEAIDNLIIYGNKDINKKTSVISFNIVGIGSSEVSQQLDYDYDIATRSGLHCAPLMHEVLGTLEQGTVRISIGYFNTKEDIEQVIKAVEEIAESAK